MSTAVLDRSIHMRSTLPHTTRARTRTRGRLAAAAAACALLGSATLSAASAATAATPAGGAPGRSSAALQMALRQDLTLYLSTRGTAEHISTVSLRVTFPGTGPAINLAVGTTQYGGGAPLSTNALWQIGSNTKAFTAVILLQLEAEGRLSINDPVGTWLPQYPAWQHITIRQLLDMTSGIPDYANQPAFEAALLGDPSAHFTTAQLVSYVAALPLGPAGYNYSNTDYILAQMIIERVTHDSYASQLTRRIIDPLGLRSTCLAPYTCPLSDAAQMPAGYLYIAGVPPSLLGQAMPPLALTWAPGAGGIVTSLADLTTWDRARLPGPAPAAPPAAAARIPGVRVHRPAHPPDHDRRPGGLRARRRAGDQQPDWHDLGVRGRELRLPGLPPVRPQLRHDHRARGQSARPRPATMNSGPTWPEPCTRPWRKKVPSTQAERPAKYGGYRSRPSSAAGLREPDRPPGRCRFGLCLRCGVWVGKSCFGMIS